MPTERAQRVLTAGVKSAVSDTGFDRAREPEVSVAGATDLGVEYLVRYWVDPWGTLSPTAARDRVTRMVLTHLAHAGITPDYPKEDVYVARMPARQLDSQSVEGRTELLRKMTSSPSSTSMRSRH